MLEELEGCNSSLSLWNAHFLGWGKLHCLGVAGVDAGHFLHCSAELSKDRDVQVQSLGSDPRVFLSSCPEGQRNSLQAPFIQLDRNCLKKYQAMSREGTKFNLLWFLVSPSTSYPHSARGRKTSFSSNSWAKKVHFFGLVLFGKLLEHSVVLKHTTQYNWNGIFLPVGILKFCVASSKISWTWVCVTKINFSWHP